MSQQEPRPREPSDSDPVDRDPILDVCLREVLGGAAPPDLTDRILARLAQQAHERGAEQPVPRVIPSAVPPVTAVPPSAAVSGDNGASPAVTEISVREPAVPLRRRRRKLWQRSLPYVVAFSLALVAGWLAIRHFSTGDPGVAGNPRGAADAGPAADGASDLHPRTDDGPGDDVDPVRPERPAPGGTELVETPPDVPPRDLAPDRDTGPVPAPPVIVDNPPPARSVATSDAEVVAAVNAMVRARWVDEGITPADPASEAKWLRRVYLDVLGRIPSVEETQTFAVDRSADKKARLLDRLLNSDDYVEEYARNWTNIWTGLLLGRATDPDREGLVQREGFQQFLRRSLLENKPYDRVVHELVSATGSNRPGDEDFNGAVNFLLDNLQENATPATAKISRVFLGMQVQCTQCHNHPFNDWNQNQFWEMNAFLRQARPVEMRRGGDVVAARLVNVNFPGEGNPPTPDEAEVYYELRNGLLQVAYPVFIDGRKINPSGWIEDVDRRKELADLIVSSDYLARAAVNRMWAHFLGYGFTKPIDDMGPHNLPSHPELLDRLASEFAGHGYDVKQLIRWITLSEAYGLSSRGPKSGTDDPQLGMQPLFAHFYMRQMRAEELYESLLVATHVDNKAGTFEERERDKSRWLQQFTIAFGTDENDEMTTFDGTIPQTLMMWNGDLIREATSGRPGTFLYEVAKSDQRNSQKINRLYHAALGRRPTAEEVRYANELWRRRGGDTLAALQDIWWVLLNSGEFILNH